MTETNRGRTLCDCPWYYDVYDTYDLRTYVFSDREQTAQILNGLITLQFYVSFYITGPGQFMEFINYIWYGFWTLFPVPTWFRELFGDLGLEAYPLDQRWSCALLKLGSLFALLMLVFVFYISAISIKPLYVWLAEIFHASEMRTQEEIEESLHMARVRRNRARLQSKQANQRLNKAVQTSRESRPDTVRRRKTAKTLDDLEKGNNPQSNVRV